MTSRLLLIGGRSGVGKSTIAFALHDLLVERNIRHAVIESDASLTNHRERSTRMAGFLDARAPADVHRVQTDGKSPEELAEISADGVSWHPAE